MSEKASLLTPIPPIRKSDAPNQSTPGSPGDVGNASTTLDGNASSVVAESQSITAFQAINYASLVLGFCLAGFAAVVLFRKASKIAEARFITGAKALGGAFALTALHGVFTTYLYANYLNDPSVGAPLVVSLLIWIPLGIFAGVILNHLLTPSKQPESKNLVFDSFAYALIFGCALLSVASGITTNAALLISLTAGVLFIVPIVRFATAFKTAKARHPELRETSDQILVNALLYLPGLIPIIAFLKVINVLSADVALFLFSFVTLDYVLITGLAMISSADEMVNGTAPATEGKVSNAATAAPAAAPAVDPIIEFLNSEEGQEKVPVDVPPPPKPARKAPPPKPAKPGAGVAAPEPPKKPGIAKPESEAPNAPSRFKAPSKPKKRF